MKALQGGGWVKILDRFMMISHAIHWVVVCSSVSSPHDAGNVTTSIAPVDMFSIYEENPYTYILCVYFASLCTIASWAGGILNMYPCMHRNPTDPEKNKWCISAYLHFCIIAIMNIYKLYRCTKYYKIIYAIIYYSWQDSGHLIKKRGPNGKSPDSTHAKYNSSIAHPKILRKSELALPYFRNHAMWN